MADEQTGDVEAPRDQRGRFGKPGAPKPGAPAGTAPAASQATEGDGSAPAPDVPAPTAPPPPPPGRVTIPRSAMRIPPRPVLTEYHVGTRRGCPHQNVTVAGISFPSFTKGALTGENKIPGARVRLSPEQILAIQKSLRSKIVRWTSGGDGVRRGQLLSVDSPGFEAVHGDEPLAAYLYCYPVPAAQRAAEEHEPASMLG